MRQSLPLSCWQVDEPAFTQPLMYKSIRSRPSSTKLYGDQLVAAGVMTEEWRASLTAKLNEHLEKEYAIANTEYSKEGGSMWAKGCRPAVSAGHPALYDGTAFAGSWSSMRQATAADLARNEGTGVGVVVVDVALCPRRNPSLALPSSLCRFMYLPGVAAVPMTCRCVVVVCWDVGIPIADLVRVGKTSVTLPSGFKAHPRLERSHLESRLEQLKGAF